MDAWVALPKQYVYNVDYSILIIGLPIYAIRFAETEKGLLCLVMMETISMEMDAQLIAEYNQGILAMEARQIVQITALFFYPHKSY